MAVDILIIELNTCVPIWNEVQLFIAEEWLGSHHGLVAGKELFTQIQKESQRLK